MKTNDLLQKLLADFMVTNVNLHNMHWNVIGGGFDEYHELTEEFYDDVFAKYDDVAEVLKVNNVYPVSSLAEYVKLTDISDLPVKDYTDEEIVKELLTIYKYFIDSFKNIREVAVNEDNYVVKTIMEKYIGEYAKKLWMIEARAK